MSVIMIKPKNPFNGNPILSSISIYLLTVMSNPIRQAHNWFWATYLKKYIKLPKHNSNPHPYFRVRLFVLKFYCNYLIRLRWSASRCKPLNISLTLIPTCLATSWLVIPGHVILMSPTVIGDAFLLLTTLLTLLI